MPDYFYQITDLNDNVKGEIRDKALTDLETAANAGKFVQISGNQTLTAADESVFIATYGTTTAAEVQAAISAGKLVMAMKSDGQSIAPLCGIASTVYSFCYSVPNATANVGYPSFSIWTLNRSTNSWNTVHTTQVAKRENPDLTGTPTAPTAAAGTNTTQIATTAFVQTAINNADDAEILTYGDTSVTYADIATKVAAGKVLFAHYSSSSDNVTLPYVCTTTSGNHVFTNMVGNTRWTIYLSNTDTWSIASAALATLASPYFTGNPTAPTQAAGNNSTRIATTAFVQSELADYSHITANIAVASNADLNSLTTPGDYYANTPTARTLSNTPYGNQSNSAIAFVLRVVRSLGMVSSSSTPNFLRQELVEYTIPSVGANIWVRYSTDGGSSWSNWAKIPTEHQTVTGVNRGGYASDNGGKYVIFAKVKKSTGTPWGALSANQYIVGNANNATVGNKGVYLLNITNRNNVFSMQVRKIMPDYGTVTFGYYSTTENGVDYWNIGVASTSGYSGIPSVFCINEGSPASTHRVQLLSEPTILDNAPTGWTAVSMDTVTTNDMLGRTTKVTEAVAAADGTGYMVRGSKLLTSSTGPQYNGQIDWILGE